MTESTSPLSTPITSLSVKTLRSMGACLSGINKFTNAQRDAGPNAKLSQIAEHISLNYILWAIKRIDKKLYRMLACDYAEHTLHLFESKYPKDMRPRNAIVAGRKVAADAATYAANAAKQNENQWQHSHTIKIIQAYESNTLDWNRMSLTESITIL